MTEGRGTGIPKILRAMKANGSPDPRFETDDDRTYFVSYFPAYSLAFAKETGQDETNLGPSRDKVTAQVTAQVLNFCHEPRKSSGIMELIGLKHWKTFQANYLKPFLQQGLLAMTIPEKPTTSKQRYVTTKTGKETLKTEICSGLGRKENRGCPRNTGIFISKN